MKKNYNYVTDNPIIKDELRVYLKSILDTKYWDISEYYDGWYFRLELTEEEATKITWFLESIIDMVNGEYK